MIAKKDIALIIDTNILRDIIADESSGNIKSLMIAWLGRIINTMSKNPKGKKIIFFANQMILKEYSNKLGQGNTQFGKTVSLVFDHGLSQEYPIPETERNSLSFRKLPMGSSPKRHRLKDTKDEKFLILLDRVLDTGKWDDRALILATRDRKTMSGMKSILVGKNVEFADSIESLKKTIEC